MRAYVRTTRNTGVSLGCLGLLILGPAIALGWIVYAAALLVYAVALLIVAGIEAIGDAVERRQHRRNP